MGWRMFLLLVVALGMALAAMLSLFSVKDTPSGEPPPAEAQGTDAGQGIRDESREALRDVLREIDSDKGKSP